MAMASQTTSTTRYVARVPDVVVSQSKTTTPCGYEMRPARSHIQTVCTPQGDGTSLCRTEEVIDPNMKRLVPMTCQKETIQIQDGETVTRTVDRMDNGWTKERVVTKPNVQTYSSTRNATPTPFGKEIPIRIIPAKDQVPLLIERKPVAAQGVTVGNLAVVPNMGVIRRDLGGGVVTPVKGAKPVVAVATVNKPSTTLKKVAGVTPAPAVAPASVVPVQRIVQRKGGQIIELPSPQEVNNQTLKLNADDLKRLQVPANYVPAPANMKAAPPGEYYRVDEGEYGRELRIKREKGYRFPFRDRPYEKLGNHRDVFQYLLSVMYKLDLKFPEFGYAYDAAVDTIATMESRILYFFGDMEAKGKYFDREEIFKDLKPDSGVRAQLEKITLDYIDAPKEPNWKSPQVPKTTPFPESLNDSKEGVCRWALMNLHDAMLDAIHGKELNIQGNYMQIGKANEEPTFGPLSFALVEDYVHAIWAQLQQHGYALNPDHTDFAGFVTIILENRGAFSATTYEYLDLYRGGSNDPNEPFMYLPLARGEQIKQKFPGAMSDGLTLDARALEPSQFARSNNQFSGIASPY